MTFNASEHLVKLQNKDYLEVKYRLVWFRDAFPHGIITTSMLQLDLDRGLAVFKAIIDDGEGGIGTGHGSETVKDFRDFIEKAETKAIGRALAALGFGTQFTGDELSEHHRIVDSPVERKPQEPLRAKSDEAKKTRHAVIEAYTIGKDKKYWQSTGEFYATLSAMTGKPINEQNVNGVADETLADLLAQPA
jgi:hypothetical protein